LLKAGKDAFQMTKLAIPLGPELTRAQAEAIVAQGKEAAIFALLQ
jgi:hypothetical protein